MAAAPQTPLRRTAGFTLIEVLVALAVLTIAIAVLAGAFTNIVLALEEADDAVAEEAELRFVRAQAILLADRAEFERGGRVETPTLGTVEWEAELEETTTVDLFAVTLRFAWSPPESRRREPREVTQTLYLLRPTWSEAGERQLLLNDRSAEITRGRDGRW